MDEPCLPSHDHVELEKCAGAKRRDSFKIAMGTMVTLGFFSVLYTLLLTTVEVTGVKEALLILLGTLGAKFGTVVDYVFGGSAGSDAKNQIIEQNLGKQ
jgi:hypothetical protein